MAASDNVRRYKDQVTSNKSALQSKNNAFKTSASRASSSWRGEVGSAFKDANGRIQQKISRLLNDMNSLNTRLSSLITAINRAEMEEKMKNK